MASYDYLQPTDLPDALEAKAKWGKQAMFMAGGTDVMVLKREGMIQFDALISLRRIPGLSDITSYEDSINLGSMVSIDRLTNDPLVAKELACLRDAAITMGCTQMRNMATLGGNVMNAVSSGDTLTPLLALGASCRLISKGGERIIPISEMFTGPKETAAADNELLSGLIIPRPSAQNRNACSSFIKLGRRGSLDLAVLNLAMQIIPGHDGKAIQSARLAAGAVGPTPMRLPNTEKELSGKPFVIDSFKEAALTALGEIRPWDDIRASRWYRKEAFPVMFKRAAEILLSRAGLN